MPQEVFPFEEAQALQGRDLLAIRSLMEPDPVSGEEHCVVPEGHFVHVIGIDAWYEADGTFVACIAVQFDGYMLGENRVAPKVILMNKTTYQQHFKDIGTSAGKTP